MKSTWFALSTLGVAVAFYCVAQEPAKVAAVLELKTPKDKISYAIGSNIGNSLKQQGYDIDPQILLSGMQDALAGKKLLLADDEARKVMMDAQMAARAKAEERRKGEGAVNKAAGEAFLAENAKKPGVVVLPSGLQYKVLTEGTGPKPKATDTVVTHYRGTLIDGTEFDSSIARGEPAEFGVTQVIKGWTEALQLMSVGSKWELCIPSDIAYGDRGAPGGKIGANSTLIFEIELLSIK